MSLTAGVMDELELSFNSFMILVYYYS